MTDDNKPNQTSKPTPRPKPIITVPPPTDVTLRQEPKPER